MVVALRSENQMHLEHGRHYRLGIGALVTNGMQL